MLEYYKTVSRRGAAELVIKKSRFIGFAKPVSTEEEAVRFIAEIKKEHSAATHNCSAYRIGERDECQKQSDDGEPSGTAGKPILEVIKNQGLKNTVVVVTRYFGGIMLGAGGLIRAYTDGAAAGIAAAEPINQVLHREVMVELDYTWLGKVEHELRLRGTLLGETQFTDKVTLRCLPLNSEAEEFVSWMTEVTQGQGTIAAGKAEYIGHKTFP
ncbi:YigZ family protein [Paenibacillus aurantius]|uniref:YigZ family protein n=1 Tax=Paenibacillus aurantius TaxID=2918900 RepID=A0AA96LC43_9BACL|nr:YigZ family protein [Paenibacillus aurantius]WNQ10383.1 YigZ family protein [Paenibacillus aurantius]